MRVVSVDEMRRLEEMTFVSGLSEHELQRRAGTAVAEAIASLEVAPRSVLAFVGDGNNGRDAWVAAQRLLDAGWSASLYLTPHHAITDGALAAFEAAGGRVVHHGKGPNGPAVQAALEGVIVAIDGLLGIGGKGALRPPLDEVVAALNEARSARTNLIVVAVDSPSGVDADTGAADGEAVVADLTVVLGGAKRGLLSAAAAQYTGRLRFADIGILDALPDAPQVLDAPSVRGLLPRPSAHAHKGVFGRLLVVAGSDRYLGAPYLVCAAAARTGAGIVTFAAPRWLRDVVASRLAEATYLPLPDGGPALEPDACIAQLLPALETSDALALGPGLTTERGVGDFVEALLRARARVGIPAVVDADGLNALAQRPGWQEWIGHGVVMTPHPGELQRLAPDEAGALWEIAPRLSARWGVSLVAKGAITAIGSSSECWVHAAPNPALASGGTGDVLTGIIGGLLARGLAPDAAARLGVWVHGRAGARASIGYAAGGLLASDLLSEVPAALAETLADPPRI